MEKGNRVTDWSPAPEDMASASDSIEYIVGTQAASTNAWTGVTKETALVAGKSISYYLPYAGTSSAATLNLTLAGGGTTGAKAIKQVYSTSSNTAALANVTNHWPVGSIMQMTYDGTQWVVSNYNTNVNQIDRENYKAAIAASAAITGGRIGVFGSDGKLKLLAANAFDTTRPILYVGTAYSADDVTAETTRTSNYTYWGSAFNLTNTHAITGGAAGKPVYIVGEMNGKMLTPTSAVLTCTEPTNEDGKIYMRLGLMSTASNAVLEGTHPLYAYVDGSFREVSPGGVLAEQYIYISKASGTTSVNANTTWVTSVSDSQNA